jgi:hypothetical protein
MNRGLAHTLVSYCPNLKWQRLAILVVVAVLLQEFPAFCSTDDFVARSYLALAETAMAERVKQAASDLRASGKTMFAS